MVLTQGLILAEAFIECLHFARPFFGYQEYEDELLGRQVGEQVITVQFELLTDGSQWSEILPTLLRGRWGGGYRKMKLGLSQS